MLYGGTVAEDDARLEVRIFCSHKDCHSPHAEINCTSIRLHRCDHEQKCTTPSLAGSQIITTKTQQKALPPRFFVYTRTSLSSSHIRSMRRSRFKSQWQLSGSIRVSQLFPSRVSTRTHLMIMVIGSRANLFSSSSVTWSNLLYTCMTGRHPHA